MPNAPPQPITGPTWTDPATGLMWARKDSGSDVSWQQADVTWQQATDYARNLRLALSSNWRLPTIDELRGIYDPNANVHGYHVKGNMQLSGWQWSSSLGLGSGAAWNFDFITGTRYTNLFGFNTFKRALCVRRSGK